MLPPIPWPSGVMEISAPSWKKPMPTMGSTAPVKNRASVPTSMGTSVTLSISTMTVKGSTLVRASRVFSLSFSFIRPPFACKGVRRASAVFQRHVVPRVMMLW